MKRRIGKLKSAAGFSLGEMLAAVLVLVMISAAAMPAALRAYQNAVDAANAQVLLSTTVSALRAELSTAWDVKVSDSTTITYKSSGTGDESVISIDSATRTIMLQEYKRDASLGWWDGEPGKTEAESRSLVPEALRKTTGSGGTPMTVVYTGASPNGEYVTISGLQVERNGKTLASISGDLLIRVMTRPTGGSG